MRAKELPTELARLATNDRYVVAPWIDTLEDALLDVFDGKTDRLIVTVPPRHGKSTLISHVFPAWWLGRRPDDRVILTSYEANFAASWGERAKSVFMEFGEPVFGKRLHPTVAARSHWGVAGHTGAMYTAGVGGPITGKGADLFIVDDPVKNADEAHSETYREKSWDWFLSTAYTRLEPGGRMIIIMTRWNEDDLVGRLLSEQDEDGEIDEEWRVINFPAIAERDEPEINRKDGEALFPERYPVNRLKRIQNRIGSYWFAALYQQRPAPLEGGIFKKKWFRYFETDVQNRHYVLLQPNGETIHVPIRSCWVFSTMDPAFTKTQISDYTALATWAVTPDWDLLLLDMRKERMNPEDIIPALRQNYYQWQPVTQKVESGGAQAMIFRIALQEGLPVQELKAETMKEVRAIPAAAKMEAGKVYFSLAIPVEERRDLEAELLTFPNAAHDDQVDTLSYAAIELGKYAGGIGRLKGGLA